MLGKESNRVAYIDLFRGFGIILMIMGHVYFGEKFAHFIGAFNMPMFFFVSGFFYGSKNSLKDTVKNKAKSLLLPYVVFFIILEIIYVITNGRGAALSSMRHFIWPNIDALEIAGPLWFLTALFFVDIIYYIIDKYISFLWCKTILIFLIALIGTTINKYLSVKLPWSLDAAFVGLGFYHIARLLKNSSNKYMKRLLDISLFPTLLMGVIVTILIFFNGVINMRKGEYAIIPLFWFNAIVSILVGMNLSRIINSFISPKFNYLICWIKYIGKNSITFLCLNKVVILFWEFLFKEYFLVDGLLTRILILTLTIITILILDVIIRKSRLKIIVGE